MTDHLRSGPLRRLLADRCPARTLGTRGCRGASRIDTYRDAKSKLRGPRPARLPSRRERCFEIFLDLLDPLGEVVDEVLETSHDSTTGNQHRDLFREAMDSAAIAATSRNCSSMTAAPASLDGPPSPRWKSSSTNKLLVIYAAMLTILGPRPARYRVVRDDEAPKLITEGEHLHSTDERYRREFDQLCYRLGVGAAFDAVGSGDWSK